MGHGCWPFGVLRAHLPPALAGVRKCGEGHSVSNCIQSSQLFKAGPLPVLCVDSALGCAGHRTVTCLFPRSRVAVTEEGEVDGAWGVQATGAPWTGDFLGQLCYAVQLLGAGAGGASSGQGGRQQGNGLGLKGHPGTDAIAEAFCVLGTHHVAGMVTGPGKAPGSLLGSPRRWGGGGRGGEEGGTLPWCSSTRYPAPRSSRVGF